MDKNAFLVAMVTAELKAALNIGKFEKEFENAQQTRLDANNQTTGNVPQQPSNGQ